MGSVSPGQNREATRRAGVCLMLLAPVLGCGEHSSPSPVPPTAILFQEYDGVGERIYTINPDGTGLHALTDYNQGSAPRWSPDGRRIVFEQNSNVAGSQILVMDADGTHRRQVTTLTGSNFDPDWSPDGSSIVFSRIVPGEGRARIALIGADGSGFRLVGPTTLSGSTPRWSPDGTRIAYSEFLPGGFPAVFVVDTDGSDVRQITDGSYDIQPVWSADGEWLVFTSIARSADQTAHLYRVAQGGGEVIALTADPFYADYTAAWAHAADRLIVECRPDSSYGTPRLCILDADGSNRRVLETTLDGQHNAPDWYDPLP